MGEPTAKSLIDRSAAVRHPALPVPRLPGHPGAGPSAPRRGAAAWLRRPRRPRLRAEAALIALGYWAYSLVRDAVPEQEGAALHHARELWRLEQRLGIAAEERLNHAVNAVGWLIVTMDYYYATLHFVITAGVLVWLFRRHPGRYAAARLTIFAATGLALLGFYFFPLAPPRLMRAGFVDTVAVHHTWGSTGSGDLAHLSNQFAAMPSMHIGWSLWCGVTLSVLARRQWVRLLGAAYPAATLAVIVCTANHFWLDAFGGAVCLTAGFAVSRLVYGRPAFRPPGRTAAAAAFQPS